MLREGMRMHIPGIGTSGMPGIARILHHRGIEVSGSDDWSSAAMADLAGMGIELSSGFDIDRVRDVDLVVRHAAMGDDNIELIAARRNGIDVVSRARLLGELAEGRRTIGVAGTHGRGTVTSMIAWILECADMAPSFVASARLNNLGVEARDGDGEWFVIELDEPSDTTHVLECDYMVCSFLELSDLRGAGAGDAREPRDWVEVMTAALEANRRLKEAFVNLDCRANRELVRRLAMRPTGYGVEHPVEYRATGVDGDEKANCFAAFHRDRQIGEFGLVVPGPHNVINAMGAIAVARRIGVSTPVIIKALQSYEGLQNRYIAARGGGVTIIKNFVDHPSSIEQALESAGVDFEGRMIAVYAPYRVSLNETVRRELSDAFSVCDCVVVADPSQAGGDIDDLLQTFHSREVQVCTVEHSLSDELSAMAQRGDKILFFGDDEFLHRADELQARLAIRAGRAPAETGQPRLDGPLAEGDG